MRMDVLQTLLAIEQIKQLKARYFRGMDNKDAALLASCFAPDASADFRGATTDPRSGISAIPSSSDEVMQGREAIVAGISGALAKLQTVHHGCCPEIEI